ncbi:erythromycin esterase family protein [Mucilaginibacter pocheonensis]|uniref:Erythromycin esterase-like protein n=1 Tax=Mucilaginibacter pocheonensis TaxID=398050 RepID=A0ABU1TDB7_9SPHI|nr:erythromycin esterase family protein [Mucilaginibacter pocheonensis]MDR6943407.1 erythromycin esterase-like protein [Mucilaginibacter pocheonensis]
MKNPITCLIFALLILVFTSVPAISQTIGEKYDLDFNGVISCHHSWISSKYNCVFLKDEANTRQGKPAVELFYQNFKQGNIMRFNLSKTLILPRNIPQKDCEVSIISKDDVNHDFWFKVTALDKDAVETDSKSIKINSRLWKENSIKIKLAGAKIIRINIYYDGDNSDKQHIWIDRILIKAGKKDITRNNYFSDNLNDSLKTIKSLNKKHIIALATGNDSTLLSGIKELDGKKIIGIAECTHGSNTSKEANYQFIKNLIINHHCRLVLLETSIAATLTWNLYIQGKISKDYGKPIEDDMRACFIDHKLFMDFLDWLRTYNMRSIAKVYISGIDDSDPEEKKLYLFNFYLTLLGKDKGAYYLKKTIDEQYDAIIAHSHLDTVLQNSLGKQNFKCYMSVLKNEMVSSKRESLSDNRDINMFKRVNSLVDLCLKPGEKAAVLAHSGHLQNLERSAGDTTLGFYIRKYYRDQYFSISFQIAKGAFSQDECAFDVKTITDSLKMPPLYSFEYAGLATGVPYFYYPAKYLGNNILTCCFIPRAGRYEDLYKFSALKRQFDAYVFIKESKPIENIEPSLFMYGRNYFYSKKMAMDSIVRKL